MANTDYTVADVTSRNFVEIWPIMNAAIREAKFVAVDVEMSGIGNNRISRRRNIQERYTYIRDVAKSRAVISLGVACFLPITNQSTSTSTSSSTSKSTGEAQQYSSSIFNVLMMSNAEYTLEPGAAKFLADHKFDFNKQIGEGLRYDPGNPTKSSNKCQCRAIFKALMTSGLLVVHNGLFDLMFMYQALFADLPDTLASFVADLAGMFPKGIVDTKYIADFELRESSSFLEYLFRKCQRQYQFKGRKLNVHCPALSSDLITLEMVSCPARVSPSTTTAVLCERYAAHGFCGKRDTCEGSHDLDDVLDVEERRTRKRKRMQETEQTDSSATLKDESEETPKLVPTHNFNKTVRSNGHRAGFDAFMTGYCYAGFAVHFLKQGGVSAFVNKVYLSGCPRPLILQKSTFTDFTASFKTHQQQNDSGQAADDVLAKEAQRFPPRWALTQNQLIQPADQSHATPTTTQPTTPPPTTTTTTITTTQQPLSSTTTSTTTPPTTTTTPPPTTTPSTTTTTVEQVEPVSVGNVSVGNVSVAPSPTIANARSHKKKKENKKTKKGKKEKKKKRGIST